jgi:hypothetical protein
LKIAGVGGGRIGWECVMIVLVGFTMRRDGRRWDIGRRRLRRMSGME